MGKRRLWMSAGTVASVSLLLVAAPASSDACSLSMGVTETGGVITGTAVDDVIDCSGVDHGHIIVSLGGDDVISGSPGAPDLIVPGAGDDEVQGGAGGHDTVDFSDAEDGVVASVAGASDDGFGEDESGQYRGVEDLFGSGFGDVLVGGASVNRLAGAEGPDGLFGHGGADRLVGGEGDDRLSGGAGPDVMRGGPGRDLASFAGSVRAVTANVAAGTSVGQGDDVLVEMEDLEGSGAGDTLSGSARANRLQGRGGADVIRGSGGADGLSGGRGADTLVGGRGDDAIDGGRGTDACVEGTGRGSKARCDRLAFGEARGVALFQPATAVIGVGFHESLFDTAVALRPHGRLRLNDNRSKFDPPEEETDGLGYVVMGTRDRPNPATSAVDIVVRSRTSVLSPVTGHVTRVRRYLLYCREPDWQVVIRPRGRSDLTVMVLHVVDVAVRRGDRVIAGVTRIGRSWRNDGPGAQENLYFPDAYPHVHVEMEAGGTAPIPGCPL